MKIRHWVALAIIIVIVGYMLAMVQKAWAQEEDPSWGWRVFPRRVCDVGWPGYCRIVWVRRKVYRHAYYPPVYGYSRRDDDDRYERRRDLCIGREIAVVSTEHTTEDHAREAARKLWMASVGWQVGGRFMDLENAADVRWRCGPSSAMDTMTGRLAEAAGKIVGRDGQNVRCQLWARPCELPRERDRERR